MNLRIGLAALTAFLTTPLIAQVTLNSSPTRVIGQTSLTIFGGTPNLVEGRELLAPQCVTLDTSTNPPAVYVSDTGNNRVLGWRSAVGFANGQKADIVIGQVDFTSTGPDGPGRSRTTGLTSPVGIVVDRSGNLYVADAGNNRILRFPRPFQQPDNPVPDLVLGQSSLSGRNANDGGISAATLAFNTVSGTQQVFPAFDAQGNLWVPDSANNRVLRYPARVLGADAVPGPDADIVLGQIDFASNAYSPPPTINPLLSLTAIAIPNSVAFDAAGRLYVGESVSATRRGRVLVWNSPTVFGQPASRLLGVPTDLPQLPPVSEYQFGGSIGQVFSLGGRVGVVDTQNSRLLLFPPAEQWTTNTQYQIAAQVVGQPDFTSGRVNRGQGLPAANSVASPASAFFAGGELYVCDTGNHRVIVLPQAGNSFGPGTRLLGQTRFDSQGPNLLEGREFNFANGEAGLAVDLNSNPPRLYVADTSNNRVLGFRDLRNIQPGQKADIVIGQPGFEYEVINYPTNDAARPNSSGLNGPTGLYVDPDGNLYVADTANGRVLRFPKPFDNYRPGVLQTADLVLGQPNFNITITDATARTMARPYGIAQASGNGLLVSDFVHHRVLFFPGTSATFSNGMAATIVFGQTSFTSTGAGAAGNQFSAPRHIATDSDDRLYVADAGNGRVQIFDHAPSARSGSFAAVTLNTGISSPRGVYVSPITGDIWVADAGSSRAVRYPQFNLLPARGFQANATLTSSSPRAVVQDAWGNLFLADVLNRVTIYYPGLSPLNAANFLYIPVLPLAPGLVTALYSTGNGKQFGTESVGATTVPLPRTLNGIQVLFDQQPVPLFFAGPDQINFQVPWNAPQTGTANLQVIEVATGRVLGDSTVVMGAVSPGIFTQDGNGRGTAVAQNVGEDGKLTLNTADNPIIQGGTIAVYATGLGFVDGAPPDGDAPTKAVPIQRAPTIILGTDILPDENILYCGLAPGLVGVWQLNLKIPISTVTLATFPTQLIIVQNSFPSGGLPVGRFVQIYVRRRN